VKKIARIALFCLVLAGTIGSVAAQTSFFGGDPMPVCDPSNPSCTIVPN
jgi:hypothetical protein